ncbi:unnamed protein product, partial [Staurois parvus]
MTRDCGHTVQEMTRDCGHSTGDDQRLRTFSGHLLYCVRSLWSSPVLCPQSLVISCTVSAVSGHLLYCVRS